MSAYKQNHSFVLSTTIIGFLALIILFVFLSSKGALPSLSEFNNLGATSTDDTTGLSSYKDILNDMGKKDTKELKLPKGNIEVEISDTPVLRERGLSGHAPLGVDQGMLFVFEKSGIYGFWMKDMSFPIDIVWIDANRKVIHVDADVAASTYPDSFFPPSNILYVLELNAGSAREFGVEVGGNISF